MLYENIVDTIGNTPLVKLNKMKKELGLKANLFVKVESFNPGGSVKDRIAYNMLTKALENKEIDKDTVIIEPTSGNTGIGLAVVCAALNMRLIICIPDSMSVERQKLIKAYGAEIVLTPGKLGMKGAISEAEKIHAATKNSHIMQQFENKYNALSHYQTAKEIMADLDNQVDVFVAGVGTGGTVSGCATYFKEHDLNPHIVAVEPDTSAVLENKPAGPHKIQGIGAGFIPGNYHADVVDEVKAVSLESAVKYTNLLAKNEGILVGFSSGAALAIGAELAKDAKYTDKNIVVILPDNGERYLSTNLFD